MSLTNGSERHSQSSQTDRDKNELDQVFDSFDRLTMKGHVLSSKILLYSAWISKPKESFLSSGQSKTALNELLGNALKMDLKRHEIPLLKNKYALPSEIIIKPFKDEKQPEPKPNMLLILSCLFYHEKKLNDELSAKELISRLEKYDIVMPRKPLKVIIALQHEDFQTYAFRPFKYGPLFIDRVSSYKSNPGSIGMQFEREMVNQPKKELHRTYGICEVTLSNLNLVVSSEVDGIDVNTGNAIEIKTKPAWIRVNNNTFLLQTWAQSAIANVQTIVTGEFTSQRGVKYGPVKFDSVYDIHYESVDHFGKKVRGKEEGLDSAHDFLHQVLDACSEIGTVYRLSGSEDGRIDCQKMGKNEYDFPISQKLIENLAEIIADKPME